MIPLLALMTAAGAHTFDAAVLTLDEVAPDQYALQWTLPSEAEILGAPTPVLPCPERDGLVHCTGELGSVAVRDLDPAMQVVTRVRWLDGAQWSGVLTSESPSDRPQRAAGILGTVSLGGRHLMEGWDHLLLVAALALVARGRALPAAIAAFTAGHAMTLAAVVLGGLALPAAPVEALIALSIAWFAREGLVRPEGPRSIVPVAAGFGLVHGLGFAGALSRIGLPTEGVWRVILGFHIGLELAQLVWLGALLLPLAALKWASPAWRTAALYGIGALSMAAFLTRLAALGVG